MENESIYLIRQAILIALSHAYGPTTFERACRDAELYGLDSGAILREWRMLKHYGYLSDLEGSDGRYVKLSVKGAEQTDCGQNPDPFIWGVRAL